MLTTKKATHLTGDVLVNGEIAINLQASIKAENVGYSSVQQTILNQELYNANKKECRKDVADFQEMVYEIEDSFLEEDEKATIEE